MKSRVLKLGLCIIILVSLVAASFALVTPVYRALGSFLRGKVAVINSTLDENFGINVSYDSLSPSILTGIKLKGIEVKDSSTGETILTVKKVTALFSIRKILKGDFENAISKITVNDVYGELIRGKNTAWVDYIIERNLEKPEMDEKKEQKSFIEMLSDADINIDIPCNVNVNNFTLVYQDSKQRIDAKAYLRRAYVEKTVTKGKYTIELMGQLSGSYKANKFSTNMVVQSSLLSHLNNSSAVIQFFIININTYSIHQMGFLCEYNDAVFKFKMLPTIQNLYVEATANFRTSDATFRFNSEKFRLANVVNGIKKGSVIDKVSYVTVSAKLNADYNWDSQKIKYRTSGDLLLPDGLVPETMSVDFALSGNQNYVTIPYINGKSENIDVGFSGAINIKALQPEGVLSVNKLQLENDGVIRTEVFFEPLQKGFMAFSPEIMFGEKTLTAAMFNFVPQNEGYDFDFEVYDYSHAQTGEPGHLSLDGNFATASKFFQSNITLDGMYIDSLMQFVAFFLDKNNSAFVNDTSSMFKNIIFSTAIYVSAYDGNFSYSIPSAIIADTTSDNRMLMVSLDGNNDNLQLTRFELIIDDQNIFATAHAENMKEPGKKDLQTILSGMVEYNSIPYSFSGLIKQDWISITGDYGLNFTFINDKDSDNLLGSFALEAFPVKLKETTLSFFANTNFSYNLQDKINVNVVNFEVQSINGFSQVNPSFAFSGRLDKTGTYLEQIAYTDAVSNLSGTGSLIWNFNNADFENAVYDIILQDPLYSEHVEIKGNLSNPENKPFNSESILKDYYISTEIALASFRTGRFTGSSNLSETMNANVSVTGSLGNPFVSISIPHGVVDVDGNPVSFSLQASVVDREFEITSGFLEIGETRIDNIESKFSFNEWNGYISLDAQTYLFDETVDLPLQITAKGIPSENRKSSVPETFEIDIKTSLISGSFIKAQQPFSIHILKLPEEMLISSSSNLGLSGTVGDNGEINLTVDNNVPLQMKVGGNYKRNSGIHFYDINCDLPKFLKLVNFKLVKVFNGKVVGDFWIKGPKNDKGFEGALMMIPAEFSMPEYFKAHAKTDVIYLYFEKDKIYTPKTRVMLKKAPVDVSVLVQFKQMKYESLTVLVETVGDAYAPIAINMNQVHVKGNAQCDLEITVEPNGATVVGSVVAKDTTAEFGTSTIGDMVQSVNFAKQQELRPNKTPFDVEVMLDVTMKSRVQVFYSTFLRGLVVPNSKVTFAFNSADEKISLDGSVPLRSGEIIYLNSSFYVKEGRIDFSSTDQGFDPYVTLRAETREKDEYNNNVTISLTVDHQRISDLSPKLTSSPAKSEKQIMELLGSFVSANSDNMASFMLATGDYALQTIVIRKVENALRDLLNFDILSIRTMVVQNALKYSMSQGSERQGMNVSNFFDNTTVYVGKYFGNALYADAMLRLTYDKNRVNDGTTLQGLTFEPEIGFEMESPLANIRWGLTPDLSDLSRSKISIVPSLTLSWKFNY